MIRLQMNERQKAVLAALIFVLAPFFGALYLIRPLDIEEDIIEDVVLFEPSYEQIFIDDMLASIERQAEIDRELLDNLDKKIYSFASPYVVLDPYGMTPLSVLVLFTSDEPLNISIHIAGKTKLADVDFVFDGHNTRHIIPVYGLYADEMNEVELTAKNENGVASKNIIRIKTEPLPLELAENILQTNLLQPDSYQPGFNFTFRKNKSSFDVNGEHRWFYNDFELRETTIYGDDRYMFIKNQIIFETNGLGRILCVYSTYQEISPKFETSAFDGAMNELEAFQTGDEGCVLVHYVERAFTGEVVWDAYSLIMGTDVRDLDYRLKRHPLYTLSANNLCIGEPVRNFLAAEVYQ